MFQDFSKGGEVVFSNVWDEVLGWFRVFFFKYVVFVCRFAFSSWAKYMVLVEEKLDEERRSSLVSSSYDINYYFDIAYMYNLYYLEV